MATYYASNSGNNANSGLTTALSWQTIGKVNTASTSMSPGDTVLFKRGDSWSGTALRPDASGNASAPITFGAYGSGARPIIAAGAAWTSAAIDTDIAYIRFEHLDFSGSSGVNYSAVMMSGHDFYADDCIFRDGDYMGFQAQSTDGALQYNITVSHCDAFSNVASGIAISSNDGTLGPHDCVVEYCNAYSNGTTRWADHGIYCRYGVVIRYNETWGNLVGGGIKVNCQLTASTWHPEVYGNKSWGNFQGIICDNWYALVYNNLFYSNEWNAGFSSGSENMFFMFNTLVNATTVTDAADGIRAINASQNFTGATILNNLIIQDRAVSAQYVWRTTGTGHMVDIAADNHIDYNVYYTDATAATNIMYDATDHAFSWTAWLAYGGSPDDNSTFLLELPDLIARYTNVGLTVGSNIYGKGIAGISLDRFGTVRPNPPSPGWYDIASTPPVTVVPSGMVFQGGCIRTGDLLYYQNMILTAETKLIDNIYSAIGTPIGAPAARLIS